MPILGILLGWLVFSGGKNKKEEVGGGVVMQTLTVGKVPEQTGGNGEVTDLACGGILEQLGVVGMDCIKKFIRDADKFHLRWIIRFRKWINFEAVFEHCHRGIGLAVHEKAA